MSLTSMCLCYLTRESAAGPEVLLGVKKTGSGAGKIEGLGGHVEPGESAAQATVREVAEESSIRVDPSQLRELGVAKFRFPVRPERDSLMWVFGADRFSGRTVESDEIAPEWFPFNELP